MILGGLKKRLYEANSKIGGKWIFELPDVICGAVGYFNDANKSASARIPS